MSTKIPWCDETWNPVTGCSKASPGCQHCYAERMFSRNLWDYDFTPGTVHPGRMGQPSRWKKPRRIFVCSMGDLFHDKVRPEAQEEVLRQCNLAPQHTFLFLTKRPWNMKRFFSGRSAPDNAWLGVTAEDEARYMARVPALLGIKASVHFVSMEPLLGPINIPDWDLAAFQTDAERKYHGSEVVDWVIAGPETGPGKRTCDPAWIDNLYDRCQDAKIPFFDKSDYPLAREWPNKKGPRN